MSSNEKYLVSGMKLFYAALITQPKQYGEWVNLEKLEKLDFIIKKKNTQINLRFLKNRCNARRI
jgi:hypothetical protein